MGSLVNALAELTGRSQQEVVNVFHSCATIDPNDLKARPSVELTEVEKALGMEPGFFSQAVGRG